MTFRFRRIRASGPSRKSRSAAGCIRSGILLAQKPDDLLFREL